MKLFVFVIVVVVISGTVESRKLSSSEKSTDRRSSEGYQIMRGPSRDHVEPTFRAAHLASWAAVAPEIK